MESVPVTPGVTYVRLPDYGLYFLCGSPPDVVKHLMRRGLISERVERGVTYEIGPNAILLSDVPVQNGGFANLAEFPILQMFYRQGMILPGHPNNKGIKPLVVGHSRGLASVAEALFRGTYGLADEAEVLETGVDAAFAAEVIREKLWFSFGSIRRSEDLLELHALDGESTQLRPGLTLRREGVNRFVFEGGGERLPVDLNLAPGQTYVPPFRLGRSRIRREYFSVVHIGEGDGWDTTRPCMGSLLQFQGKNYLIDAGPNILESLEAIGLGLTEIEGVFQTHGHDDHFAGLPSLAMSDHRLKFFSTRLVRSSVMKKMAALMGVPERTFSTTFEFKELEAEAWNDVEGLLVRPSWSPHPVETNVYSFRANGDRGAKTYSHWADIAAFPVLKKLLVEAADATPASRALYTDFTRYLGESADLKKVDIGGGMIHGSAEDFVGDASGKVVLAHIDRPGTAREKEIGSFVDFGVQDVLIPARQDYRLRVIEAALKTYFPHAPQWERDLLLNGVLRDCSPGTVLQRRDELFQKVLLVVGGVVEAVDGETGRETRFSAGSLIGELHVLTGRLSTQTWRARSFVTILEIPRVVYTVFSRKNIDLEEQLRVAQVTLTLQDTPLFGDAVSSVHLTRIARKAKAHWVAKGQPPFEPAKDPSPFLFLVERGSLVLEFEGKVVETIGPGGFCGEEGLFFRGGGNLSVRATVDTHGLAIPSKLLLSIPIVGWKLLETYERRLTSLMGAVAQG
jgi:hemerythrin